MKFDLLIESLGETKSKSKYKKKIQGIEVIAIQLCLCTWIAQWNSFHLSGSPAFCNIPYGANITNRRERILSKVHDDGSRSPSPLRSLTDGDTIYNSLHGFQWWDYATTSQICHLFTLS